jgi:ubiquinone/menaquinone biosynthesis C-methylase UbiE
MNAFINGNGIEKYLKGKILDVGCGEGDLLLWAKEHGFSGEGADIDKRAISCAKKKGVTAKFAYAEWIPYKDKVFDCVVFSSVLEHLDGKRSRERAIREVKRVLKDGGRVITKTPYAYDPNALTHHDHAWLWTLDSLSQFLNENGFIVEEAYHYWHLPFERLWLRAFRVGNLPCPIRNHVLCRWLSLPPIPYS